MSYSPYGSSSSCTRQALETLHRWAATHFKETTEDYLIPRISLTEKLRLGIFEPEREVTMIPARTLMKPLAAEGWTHNPLAPALTRVIIRERVNIDPLNPNKGTRVATRIYYVQGVMVNVQNPSTRMITPRTLLNRGIPEDWHGKRATFTEVDPYDKGKRAYVTESPDVIVESVTVFNTDTDDLKNIGLD